MLFKLTATWQSQPLVKRSSQGGEDKERRSSIQDVLWVGERCVSGRR